MSWRQKFSSSTSGDGRAFGLATKVPADMQYEMFSRGMISADN
jgi:hypothetical protein